MQAWALPGRAADEWTVTTDIPLISKWPRGKALQADNITADLFRSRREGRLPAVVIVNSSGGITANIELYYARLLASQGMAALVVDSFTPRGIHNTEADQSQIRSVQSAADGAAGFRWLAAQPWVDPTKIIILGMSKGGIAALVTAVEADRRLYAISDARFAAHVSISPNCGFQNQDARTTGAPIFFMLMELDDHTPVAPCFDQIERLRATPNAKVRFAVYPGVHHGVEITGGLFEEPAERSRRCSYFRVGENYLDRSTGKPVPASEARASFLKNCIEFGTVTSGGDGRVKAQASADLLQFLRDVDILEDREARAVVPDCTRIPTGIVRLNCERARNGWNGDLVALGRVYRSGKDVPRDDGVAASLFRLAAQRGEPAAQIQLAFLYREGAGVPQDLAEALKLARTAADAGQPVAMNFMGVMLRDGVGTKRDDVEAVHWFRQAAELRNPYGLANLGEMFWTGRGGLTQDRKEAVTLFRKSAFFENAWGRLFLARALESGDGADRNLTEATALYRLVAATANEPAAKKRAVDALALLGAAARP